MYKLHYLYLLNPLFMRFYDLYISLYTFVHFDFMYKETGMITINLYNLLKIIIRI